MHDQLDKAAMQKELKRWFGPSLMSMPLQQRIVNRGIMAETHHLAIYFAEGNQYEWVMIAHKRTRNHEGKLKQQRRRISIAQRDQD